MGTDHKKEAAAQSTTCPVSEMGVFLSYNSKNETAAVAIQKSLEATGLHVWIDNVELSGGDITPQLKQVFESVHAAAFLVGEHGIGRWQGIELEALLEPRGNEDPQVRLVPVMLPGATKDSLPESLRAKVGVQFKKAVNEVPALRRLFRLLTGQEWPRGTCEIHIEVEEIAMTCLAVLPEPDEIGTCEMIQGALNEVNDHLNAEIRFQCGAEDSVQLYRGIRGAEVIVADCRPLEDTSKTDPFVLYQVGLAQAVGKPIIVIVDSSGYPDELYPTPHFVVCDESDADWEGKLRTDLVEHMELLASYAILQLVAHDWIGVTATYSPISPVRPLLFDGFRTVWRTGLNIHQWSREIAKHVHRLSDIVSDLEADVEAASKEEATPDAVLKRVRNTFRKGLEKRFANFQRHLDGNGDEFSLARLREFAQGLTVESTPPQLNPTRAAFLYLEEKTTERDALGCVRAASVAFNRAVRTIEYTCQVSAEAGKAFSALRDRFANGVDPDKPLGELAYKVRELEMATHDIDRLTVNMMSSLLEAME